MMLFCYSRILSPLNSTPTTLYNQPLWFPCWTRWMPYPLCLDL